MAVVNVSLVDGRPGELYSLFDWLQRVDEFRGQVRTPSRQPGPDDMGSLVEILSVAIGSGGAGTVLAGSLTTWLQTRRARISVEVVTDVSGEIIRKIEIDAGSPAVTERLLRGVLVGGEEAR
jgi:hypothetical protein